MLSLDPLALLGWKTLPDSLLSSLCLSFSRPGCLRSQYWPLASPLERNDTASSGFDYTAAFTPLTSVCLCVCVFLCVCFLSILTATCGFLPQLRLRSCPEKWQNWSLCLFVAACFVDLNCDSFLLASAVLETWCNGPVWVSSVLHLSPTDIK